MKRMLLAGISLCVLAGVAACSSGSITPLPRTAAALSAATATGCASANAQNQSVALPSAGGVTGTISLGPVASVASGCPLSIEVATGADATLSVTTTALGRRGAQAASPAPLPSPLAQVDLTSQTTSASWLAISLTLPSSVPAGSYPATVTTSVDLGDGQTYAQTFNYTLTVGANGAASLTGINVTFGQYSAGLLTIYPIGTVLPSGSTPNPTPSATPTGSPTGTPTTSPSAAPTATPTVAPTSTPSASPTATPTPSSTSGDCMGPPGTIGYGNPDLPCGTYTASGYYDGGTNQSQSASGSGTIWPLPALGNVYITIPGGFFVGTIVVELPGYDIGFPQTLVAAACPSIQIEQSGTNGDTYTLTFPPDGSQYEFSLTNTCVLSVQPPTTNSGVPGFEASLDINVLYGYGN